MIYATSISGAIGINGDLPWGHLEADMKWFKEHTKNKVVVMGRATWESLPKKLPNRINVVITNQNLDGPDLLVKGEPHEVIETLLETFPTKDIMIIGGANVYAEFYHYAEKVYVTLVKGIFDGDTFFDMRGMMQRAYKLDYEVQVPGDEFGHPDLLFEIYSRPVH